MKKEEMQAQPFAKLWGYESDYYRVPPPLKNNLRYGMLNGRPDALSMLKKYRGLHIGRHLMKDAARLVEDRQFRSIRLTVDETNTIARHLYDTEGFILTGNKTFEGDKTLLEMRKHI